MSSPNPCQFQTAKFFDGSKDDRGVHAQVSKCLIAGVDIHISQDMVKFGTAITNASDIPLRAKHWQSENMVVRSSLLLDSHMDTQAKKQTKILSKVKSAKDNISKLFKTTGRVCPAISNLGPFAAPCVRRHGMQDVHPLPLLTPVSRGPISAVCDVTVSGSFASGKTSLETVTSLLAYSELEEHVDDFISISRCAAEAPSLWSPVQLLAMQESERITPSTIRLNELPTIEEEVGDTELSAERLQVEPKPLTTSRSRGPLTTSDSEAKYDAMLAAEFATFSFYSKDIREWSDEVEREKQAKMDAHFAYVSEALAVPVPKLSAFFATDCPADFTTVNKDEFIDYPSPIKTETSETNTSSADSSLVTSVDAEDDRPQLSPIMLCGLRRVRNHEDLKNVQAITNSSDSFSDLSCWSFDMDTSDSTAAVGKIGALRRSMKSNDLRTSFLLLEFGISHTEGRKGGEQQSIVPDLPPRKPLSWLRAYPDE